MTSRHDEVVPEEVLKPLLRPSHRRPLEIGLSIRIPDVFFCPGILKIEDQFPDPD